MNNEEAIKAIQDFIGWFKTDSRIYKALEMAVKALSQEPICPSAGVDCEDCPADDAISRILKRMWNCRGKHTTSIDKVAMEQIIRDELSSVTSKPIECDDTVSRGVFEQVRWERDVAIEQLHELGYELGQKIEPCDAISRDDVMQILYDYDCINENALMVKAIKELPYVTQKSGKWILTIEDWNKWACSNCGYVKRTDIHVNIGWKYCPNCGAKMESEV